MRKQVRFGIATAFCAVASLVAHAETVAWWRFEEKAPGEAFEASTAVVDSCGNALDGSPLVVAGTSTSAGWNAKPEVRPAPVLPFAGKKVYDPVSATTNDNGSALRTTFADSAQYKAWYGGVVRIPGSDPSVPDATQPTDAITVECFVCTTNTTVPNTFMPIVGKKRGSTWTSETWALYAQADGKIALRIYTDKPYIKGYGGNTPLGTHAINDGAWHHVAFTYDKATGDAKVYVDYELDQTHKLTQGEPLRYDSDATTHNHHALWIGGYPYRDDANGRIFNGFIDEVRISDAVLEPAQFLHLVSTGGDDKDVILHIPFEGSSSLALTEGAVLGGTVGGVQAVYHATKAAAGASAAFDTIEKAGASVGSGLYADSTVADASSLRLVSANAGAKGCFVQAPAVTSGLWTEDPGLPVTNFNYTVECFAKAAAKGQARRTILKIGASASYIPAHFITGDSDHSSKAEFCCALNAGHDWTSLGRSSADFDDGEWHHLALVSDATNKAVRVYFDYRLVATKSNVYLPVAPGFGLYVGCKERGEGQFFDGWIDDVRVTKRALDPEEFLTTHAVGSATQPLLAAMLEQDYEFTGVADDYWSVKGTGAARSGGSDPVFQKVSRGTLLLDGANGSSRAVNEWSARADRSNITFPASLFYELDSYTVEFWAKFDGYKDGATEVAANCTFDGNSHFGILRFVQGDTTTFDWYLFRIAGNPNAFQVAIRQADGKNIAYKSFLLDRLVADGKWHHYALQISHNAANTEGSVMLYADGTPLAADKNAKPEPQDFDGLYKGATSHRLMFFESSAADKNILGNIDAVRFWRGTPDPSQFLCRAPNGLMLIVR